jgi:hypothetical protein
MKIVAAQRASVDVNLLDILEPQPSRAVRTPEAADRIRMAGIRHTQRHRPLRPDVRAVDPANHASAQDAHEVGPDFSVAPQRETLWHDAPPLDPAPRSIYVIPAANILTPRWLTVMSTSSFVLGYLSSASTTTAPDPALGRLARCGRRTTSEREAAAVPSLAGSASFGSH